MYVCMYVCIYILCVCLYMQVLSCDILLLYIYIAHVERGCQSLQTWNQLWEQEIRVTWREFPWLIPIMISSLRRCMVYMFAYIHVVPEYIIRFQNVSLWRFPSHVCQTAHSDFSFNQPQKNRPINSYSAFAKCNWGWHFGFQVRSQHTSPQPKEWYFTTTSGVDRGTIRLYLPYTYHIPFEFMIGMFLTVYLPNLSFILWNVLDPNSQT